MFGETPEYQSGLMEELGYNLEYGLVCIDYVGCNSLFLCLFQVV